MQQNKYELGVIVRADLSEDGLRAEMDRITGLLDRFGATIDKVDDWGRRKLAYPIEKQAEGVYSFIYYTAPGTTPREVESRIRLMENVLRFLTVNLNEVEDRKAKAKASAPAEESVVAEPVAEAAEEPVATPEPAVAEPATVEPAEEPAE